VISLTSIRGHQSLVRSYLLSVDASPVDTTTLEYRVCMSVIKVQGARWCDLHDLGYIFREKDCPCAAARARYVRVTFPFGQIRSRSRTPLTPCPSCDLKRDNEDRANNRSSDSSK
jgi:hypothetical protein